ncbi:MAG TPA: HepT-like ribonuclease domain-containing protein [Mycobacteriales bacterium]|nr:HepT-like ribonuclease domain-containing protein [Mycobacteriales bacterium]
MSRRDRERLDDIVEAIIAIRSHVSRGDLSDDLIFDAVRVRLIEIGEAIKALPSPLVATEPSIPWSDIARLRDRLAHHYFDTEHSIVAATVANDIDLLEAAVMRIRRGLNTDDDS